MKKELFEDCGIIEVEGERYMLTNSASSWFEYNSNDPENTYFRHWAYKLNGDEVETDEDKDPIFYQVWYLVDDDIDPEDIDYDNPTFIK